MHYRYKFIWQKLATFSRFITWLVAMAAIGLFLGGYITLSMPGQSYSGELPPLSAEEKRLTKILQKDVAALAGEIGERNAQRYAGLLGAADFIEKALREAGYEPRRQSWQVNGKWFYNIEAEIRGIIKEKEIFIVGSHYDSAPGCPGANDNASGTAATLALARYFAGKQATRTLRFVFLANEEPADQPRGEAGSVVYARGCAERREKIIAMLYLASLGYYSDQPGSQQYPLSMKFFYPRTGNFIGFIGNATSKNLVQAALGSFRENARFPSEGLVFPDSTEELAISGSWPLRQQGYRALVVTDTAPFRYLHHHGGQDLPLQLNYEYMARVVAGLQKVITALAPLSE